MIVRLPLPSSDEPPLVTVIMPVRNEAGFIERSLGAVLTQEYPLGRLEVIVADGMSTDETRNVVRQIQEKHPELTLIDNPGGIVPTGLNAALTQARGDIVVRVDGHTIIEPDYVQQCVTALAKSDADNVGGRMDAVSQGFIGRATAAATSSPFGVGGARFHYSNREEWVDTVYLGAWRRDVFERIGLFDEEQVRNQDDEFNYRLRAHDGKILLCPQIKSRYYNRATLRSLWRQYLQYGYWKVRVMQKHPRQMQPRQFAPAALVLGIVVSMVGAAFSTFGLVCFALLTGSYLVANLVGSLVAAQQNGWRYLVVLPCVLATIHFSYGLGFLGGLLRFAACWRAPGQLPPGLPAAASVEIQSFEIPGMQRP